MGDHLVPYPHESDIEIFRESLAYSAAETGFTVSLIEKDYYCSLVLDHFFNGKTELVFKGGTSLSKVYLDFYRLSEDLDFIIPVSKRTTKSQRKSKIDPVKSLIDELTTTIPGITISSALTGHNQSRQYIGTIQYNSAVVDKSENIKIEIGLREPLIQPYDQKPARTIAVNPFNQLSLIPEFPVQVMNVEEAFAEKVRAALTRREPAIRDFYDLQLAVDSKKVDLFDPGFLEMVTAKLIVPGNDPINVSTERRVELDRQLETQLKSVLRTQDFDKFNLDHAYQMVVEIAVVTVGSNVRR